MASASESLVLGLSHVGVSYRAKPVLRGIDWEWSEGQHWAVIGPNGAGKTALARVVSGEQAHYSGELRRGAGVDKGIAYVCFERSRQLFERDQKLDCSDFDETAQDVGTRVRDLLLRAEPSADEMARVVSLLDLGLILDRGLRYVSTGEMRKALLASALLGKPGLLILDSPLDGLDRAMQARLRDALEDVLASTAAVMLLCRSPDEVPAACTHVMLLNAGRIALAGAREEVLTSPILHATLNPPLLRFQQPDTADRHPAAANTGTAPSPTIELLDVSVHWGNFCVFRDLSWTFRRDQHCLVAGPNGCGKSTLLDLLTGDNHKAYGQNVSLFGQRRGQGESVWEIKARFGRVDARMQFAVPSGSSVLAVVLGGFFDSLGLRDAPSDLQRRAARHWLQALDLNGLAQEEFHTLSFGMQRLVLLARAMVRSPRILLLDEATLSLDPGHRRMLLDAIDHVVAHGDCQLLFVSHTVGEVPACINQQMRFEPHPEGSRVQIVDAAP